MVSLWERRQQPVVPLTYGRSMSSCNLIYLPCVSCAWIGSTGQVKNNLPGKFDAGLGLRGRTLVVPCRSQHALRESIKLTEQLLQVDDLELKLVLPASVDEVLDWYIEQGIENDPYWSQPWPSALALAQQLLRRPGLVKGKSVCDLGAGIGLAGMVALAAGAAKVVLCDRERMALDCALLSAAASGLLPNGSGTAASSKVRGELQVQQLDWTECWRGPKFDVVLACDVLYEPEAAQPIADLVPQLLPSSRGSFLLAHPANRLQGKLHREDLMRRLGRDRGGLLVEEDYQVAVRLDGILTPVQITKFRRSQGHETVGIKLTD